MDSGLRFTILRRDGFTCRYCGQQPPIVILEVDHVLPRSHGGKDTEANLVTACFTCNRGKRDKMGVLPPASLEPKPVPYPAGMFFNLRGSVLGIEAHDRYGDMLVLQGVVVAVQGDDVWCEVCDDEGVADTVRSLPRNAWRGWYFYPTSREMRRAWAVDGYHSGRLPFVEVERFEEWDAIRFDDKARLRAFYDKNPWFDPAKRVPYLP